MDNTIFLWGGEVYQSAFFMCKNIFKKNLKFTPEQAQKRRQNYLKPFNFIIWFVTRYNSVFTPGVVVVV